QTVESRLWEDPFKTLARSSHNSPTDPYKLSELIQARADKREDVLILSVMIPGGFYSEDQENRIRSRFAIASALGELSYVPEDAEHIGAVTLPWPTIEGIKELEKNAKDASKNLVALWSQAQTGWVTNAATRLDLRYEWYRPQSFKPPSPPSIDASP